MEDSICMFFFILHFASVVPEQLEFQIVRSHHSESIISGLLLNTTGTALTSELIEFGVDIREMSLLCGDFSFSLLVFAAKM